MIKKLVESVLSFCHFNKIPPSWVAACFSWAIQEEKCIFSNAKIIQQILQCPIRSTGHQKHQFVPYMKGKEKSAVFNTKLNMIFRCCSLRETGICGCVPVSAHWLHTPFHTPFHTSSWTLGPVSSTCDRHQGHQISTSFMKCQHFMKIINWAGYRGSEPEISGKDRGCWCEAAEEHVQFPSKAPLVLWD